MGKAFVAKLAKAGARDPEALAAWIGRKKHGKAAFRRLAAGGRENGKSSGESSSPAPKPSTRSSKPAGQAVSDAKVADAQARNDEQAAQRPTVQEPGGFTAEEERKLSAAARQTANMDHGQLQAYEETYKPTPASTRDDHLRYEAVQRELKRRKDEAERAVHAGVEHVRALNEGAREASLDRMGEGITRTRLRRMTNEDVERNYRYVKAVILTAADYDMRFSRADEAKLHAVAGALTRELNERHRKPL